MRKRISVEERFWKKVFMLSYFDCWIWMGSIDGDGYGHFALHGFAITRERNGRSLERG
jgi:hypothetical protein